MFKFLNADAQVRQREKKSRTIVPSSTLAGGPTVREVMLQIKEDVAKWDSQVQQKLKKVA